MTLFVGGRYTNSFNGSDVGISEDGAELQQDSAWEAVQGSDAFGDSIIDGFYRGGNCYLQYTCLAFKASSEFAFWHWSLTLGNMQTHGTAAVFPMGMLASANAKATVLTVDPGTPAAIIGAAAIRTLTASLSILAPGSNLRLLFSSKLRKVPIRLQLLPSEGAPVGGLYTTNWFALT